MSEETLLMSIGYGRRSIGEFIDALRERGVAYVVDVRSKPFARNPEFTRDALAAHLAAAGVAYLFLGGQLGGIPDDDSCYDENGRVDYGKCRRRPAFREGLGRLIRAHELGLRVAIMCAEAKPQDCHRSKMIGPALQEVGVELMHICEDGSAKSQSEVMALLAGGQLGLFGPDVPLTSRRRYRPGR